MDRFALLQIDPPTRGRHLFEPATLINQRDRLAMTHATSMQTAANVMSTPIFEEDMNG
jgi:hypothetical protein